MKTNLVLALSVIFALLQGPFLPPIFFEGLLVVLILSSGVSNKAIMQLFLSGLIFDLVQSTHIGITPVIFIAAGFLVYLLRSAVPFQRPWFASILAFAVVALRGKILFSNFFGVEALLAAILVFLLLNYILRPGGDNRLEIR